MRDIKEKINIHVMDGGIMCHRSSRQQLNRLSKDTLTYFIYRNLEKTNLFMNKMEQILPANQHMDTHKNLENY